MKRFGLWLVAVGLLASACQGRGAVSLGSAPSGSPGSSPSGSPPTETPSPSVTPTQSSRKLTFEVWLGREAKLFVTKRTEPFTPSVGRLALDALIAGPTEDEAAAGVGSAIPNGTVFTITDLAQRVATVDAAYPPSWNPQTITAQMLPKAQVVYTLTQYATIRKVRFTGEAGTYTRRDFDQFLPAILVESPTIGSKVSSPVTVSGTANVFEATVSLRILDENGKEIARTFTTATCGTGCRGDYSVSVPFTVDHRQRGTIEVFESSAKDGSRINVVDIPVILMP